MDPLTWTGALGPVLYPLFLAALAVFVLGFVANLGLGFAGIRAAEAEVNADGTLSYARTPMDYALMMMKFATFGVLAIIVAYAVQGIVLPDYADKGILGAMAQRLWPTWLALIVTFALSITFKRRLGLYGKLFDSLIGMIGFGIVMFWIFTAVFSHMITTHDAVDVVVASLRNELPGTPLPQNRVEGGLYPYFLLGGDNGGSDVFSRLIEGSSVVLQIAPLATLFAFMVGITLGLPAGYFGGWLDTILTFIANLVLAFPVILLFFLLVTPEIVESGAPNYMAAILFIFPIVFFAILINSRFYVQPQRRTLLMAALLVIGGALYLSVLSDPRNSPPFTFLPESLDLLSIDPNLLIVFVSVVFVNSPTVFRIVRGIVLDIRSRDYVAAGQTRGEGPWYIMLWEMLPNARGPLIVDFCLRIGYTTILLGTLGFFGLGLSPDSPNWGATINEGRGLLTRYPMPALAPALALMSLVLGLNLLADGLREESLKD